MMPPPPPPTGQQQQMYHPGQYPPGQGAYHPSYGGPAYVAQPMPQQAQVQAQAQQQPQQPQAQQYPANNSATNSQPGSSQLRSASSDDMSKLAASSAGSAAKILASQPTPASTVSPGPNVKKSHTPAPVSTPQPIQAPIVAAPAPQPMTVPVAVPVVVKKEITFPADSVEATMPLDSKKRKITSKEIGPVDPWKLYMSLKSGLLAETTWALDALNILLYDDSTIAYFHLKHFPGLLQLLLEHFLKCLRLIFDQQHGGDEFGDIELDLDLSDRKQQPANSGESASTLKMNGYHDDANASHHVIKVADKRYGNKQNVNIKYNDSRACKEWYEHNKELIDKYVYKSCDAVNSNNDTNNNINNSKTVQKVAASSDDYIICNFNHHDDLDRLNNLFYGGPNYQQKLSMRRATTGGVKRKIIQPNDNDDADDDDKHTMTSKSASLETNNERFFKLHRLKRQQTGGKADEKIAHHKYDDQAVSGTGGNDDAMFRLVRQRHVELMSRCSTISTILRNLSFVPGNDAEMCKSHVLLKIFARLIILKHKHRLISHSTTTGSATDDNETRSARIDHNDASDQDDDDDDDDDDCYLDDEIDCLKKLGASDLFYVNEESQAAADDQSGPVADSLVEDHEYWWECVHILRENTLVTLANISGALNLNSLDEDIIRLYAHGLVCEHSTIICLLFLLSL